MKKKLLILGLITALSLSITSCSDDAKKETSNDELQVSNTEIKQEGGKQDVLETYDMFETNVILDEADSNGNIYGKMTVKNNSKFPLTKFVAAAVRGNNEKTYFICDDTVMPGDTSPIFTAIISENGESTDFKFIKYEYELKNEDKKLYTIYDIQLDEYESFDSSDY